MQKILLFATLLAIGGCAASYTEPSLPADHPASPAATEATPPTRWQTLDLATADPMTSVRAESGKEQRQMADMPTSMPSADGTDIDPRKPKTHTPAPAGKPMSYACPMHPEVTSDKPDQRCPKCNMKLKPIAAKSARSGEPK